MGDVIQFLYGEDGMDGAAIESQTMEHLRWDRKKLEVCFAHYGPLVSLTSCHATNKPNTGRHVLEVINTGN